MVDVCFEIPKEEYEKALTDGAKSIINPGIVMGYGVTHAKVTKVEGKYYLSYSRGESCD